MSQPSHFSISMRQEFGVMPGTFLDIMRAGVRMLTQPPLSIEVGSPGWSGS